MANILREARHFLVEHQSHLLFLASLLFATTILSSAFFITRGASPSASELAFIESSAASVGSVIPASCESGYEHYTDECDACANADASQYYTDECCTTGSGVTRCGSLTRLPPVTCSYSYSYESVDDYDCRYVDIYTYNVETCTDGTTRETVAGYRQENQCPPPAPTCENGGLDANQCACDALNPNDYYTDQCCTGTAGLRCGTQTRSCENGGLTGAQCCSSPNVWYNSSCQAPSCQNGGLDANQCACDALDPADYSTEQCCMGTSGLRCGTQTTLCANGATNYPTCDNICTNGYMNYPTCGPISCANGATNYPTCDNICTNGYSNYPTCGPTSSNCNAQTIGSCTLSATSDGGTSGSCANGYGGGSCSYRCNSGTWASSGSNTCSPPVVIQFRVCTDATGVCTSAPGIHNVALNTPLTISWNANADACSEILGPGFATGGRTTGSDAITAVAVPGTPDTYRIACRYGSGVPVQSTLYVSTQLPPVLTVNRSTVSQGGSVTVSWDTNNGDEASCSLSGAGLSNGTLSNGTGDAETGFASVTVNGRTTFVLTCLGLTSVKTVEIIPQTWES